MDITGKTKILGILGYPIDHSLSPVFQNAALTKLGLPYVYIPFSIPPDKLNSAVRAIPNLNIIGVNVTIPHKEKVIPNLNQIDRTAYQIGAVNTICNVKGKLYGYNTDIYGFIKSCRTSRYNPTHKNAMLIGAGGAGKSLAFGLAIQKINRLVLVDIDTKKMRNLALRINRFFPRVNIIYGKITDKFVQKNIKETDILLNATPLGMHPGDKLPIPAEFIHPRECIFDVIYNQTTELLKLAHKAKLLAINGLDMLIYQGAKSFSLWTKRDAPIDIMNLSLRPYLPK